MNLGFNKLKLSQRLSLLFGLPLIITTGFVAFTFRNNFEEHLISFSIVIFLLLVCGTIAILFIQRLSQGVKKIDMASKDLAMGRLNNPASINGLPETTEIGVFISQIREDLLRQAEFAKQLKAGNLEANYLPRHDDDVLGNALVQIKNNLIAIKQEDEQRNWASEGLAKFVQVLQSAKDLKSIANDIVVNLVRIIKANQGAVFLVVKIEGKEFLEMQSCYAYNRTKHLSQTIQIGEGLIGQAFVERQTIYLKEVPDHFVRITSGLGEANPRHILIVPLRMNETIVGIIELASFREFTKNEISFVEKIGESIAYTVSTIRTADQTRRIVDALNTQAEQMKAQEEELRQNQEELQTTQEAISRKYDSLFKKLGELNHRSKFDQLKSITSTKKRNVEYYFDIIRSQILTFSEDRMIIEAVRAFKHAFYDLGNDLSSEKLQRYHASLKQYYEEEFVPRLNDNTSTSAVAQPFIPSTPRAQQLQYLYISDNVHPTGKKSLLNDAGDGSEYSKVHATYHPILRNFLEKFGYYDIFLLDADTGDMLYSVFKEVDFATSLLSGKYSTTNFGKVARDAMTSQDRNFVRLIDFEPYDPSYHAPASFIACPIYDGDSKTGILVFQMPINKINQILTGNNKWREDGLGDTGETFMLGADFKLRSISRQLIEDMQGHLNLLKRLNYDPITVQQIQKMETSILMEEIRQDAATKALTGVTGTQLDKNSLGVDVLSAYAPLEIPDVHWIIMSIMTEEEASTPINSLRDGDFD